MTYILASKRIQRSSDCLYMYRLNEQSATNTSHDEGILNSMDALYEFKSCHSIFTKHINALLMYFIGYLIKNGNMSYKQIAAKHNSLAISSNEYMSSIERQYIKILQFSPFYAYWYLRIRNYVGKWKKSLKNVLYEKKKIVDSSR